MHIHTLKIRIEKTFEFHQVFDSLRIASNTESVLFCWYVDDDLLKDSSFLHDMQLRICFGMC